MQPIVILYDLFERSECRYVSSVQEPFMIVTLGPRSSAWRYQMDDAKTVIRRVRALSKRTLEYIIVG